MNKELQSADTSNLTHALGYTNQPQAKPRRARSSKLHVDHGSLTVKVYPVNEDALETLNTLSRDLAILMAIATGFLGFALDLTKDIVLANGTPPARIAFFAGVDATCWVVGALCGIGAFGKWRERGTKMSEIKSAAEFAESGPS